MKNAGRPDVFTYTDHRLFLREMFAYYKKTNRVFTYRYFSARAGLASPSILKEVIDGKKRIAAKRIRQFALPFKMTQKETAFFENLVQYNQADDDLSKNRYFREMVRLQRTPKAKKVNPKQYPVYREWYNVVVREIVALKDFKDDPAWIAARISPQITPEQAAEALRVLLKLKLIKRDETGNLAQDAARLQTDPDVLADAYREFARRMIELSWEAVDRFAPDDREVSSLTMNMSRDCYRDVKKMIQKAKDDILDYVTRHPAASDVVCQLNVELFPLVSDLEKKKREKRCP